MLFWFLRALAGSQLWSKRGRYFSSHGMNSVTICGDRHNRPTRQITSMAIAKITKMATFEWMSSGNIEAKVVDIKKHGDVENRRVYLKFTYACLLHIKTASKPMVATKNQAWACFQTKLWSRVEEPGPYLFRQKKVRKFIHDFFSSKRRSNEKSDLLAFGGVMKIGFDQLRKILYKTVWKFEKKSQSFTSNQY